MVGVFDATLAKWKIKKKEWKFKKQLPNRHDQDQPLYI